MSPKKFGDYKFALWLCPRISGTVYRRAAMFPKKIRERGPFQHFSYVPEFFSCAVKLCAVNCFVHKQDSELYLHCILHAANPSQLFFKTTYEQPLTGYYTKRIAVRMPIFSRSTSSKFCGALRQIADLPLELSYSIYILYFIFVPCVRFP